MMNVLLYLPELQGQEMNYVQMLLNNCTEEQATQFAQIYRARRKDPTLILITCLLGFFVLAGVHRFILGQIGMGILYLFTGGLCLIGTIVDLVNYQTLAFEYNQQMANEVATMMNLPPRN